LFFYAAAVVAYDSVGLESSDDEYAAIAEEVCLDYMAALKAVAVENESNPAKLKWNC
jgi:phage I-like protein